MKKFLFVLLVLIGLAGAFWLFHPHMADEATCTESSFCRICKKEVYKATGHDYTMFTCTDDAVCKNCGDIKWKALGHQPNRKADCTHDSICNRCKTTLAKATGHLEYTYTNCLEDALCNACGEVAAPAIGEHSFKEATCLEPMTCEVCGETKGNLGKHKYLEATCTEPMICEVCKETYGKPKGHISSTNKCEEEDICKTCNKVIRKAGEHAYEPATCTTASYCKNCKTVKGEALGHDYSIPATCTKGESCSRCGKTSGNALGHDMISEVDGSYVVYTCSRCDYSYKEINYSQQLLDSYAAQVVNMVNQERANYGLNALVSDYALTQAAKIRSEELATSFSHVRPNGYMCTSLFPDNHLAAENVGRMHKTPEQAMNGWMNSEGHRANILREGLNKIGVGVYYDETTGILYWAQCFTD